MDTRGATVASRGRRLVASDPAWQVITINHNLSPDEIAIFSAAEVQRETISSRDTQASVNMFLKWNTACVVWRERSGHDRAVCLYRVCYFDQS